MPLSTYCSIPVTKLKSSDARKSAAGGNLAQLTRRTYWNYGCPSFLEERHQISPCLLCWGYYIDPNLSFELASPSSGRKNGWLFASTVNGRARNPLTPAELFRMIDPPSFMSGIAFCTVKKAPQTLTLNVSSEPFSVMEPSGLLSSLTPALAKRTSI